MNNIKYLKNGKYKCLDCGEVYEDETEALQCCPGMLQYVDFETAQREEAIIANQDMIVTLTKNGRVDGREEIEVLITAGDPRGADQTIRIRKDKKDKFLEILIPRDQGFTYYPFKSIRKWGSYYKVRYEGR